MADWNNPTQASLYTDVLAELKDRDVDIAKMFDGSTSTNIPEGSVKWDSSASRWRRWISGGWRDLAALIKFPAVSVDGDISGQTITANQQIWSNGIIGCGTAPTEPTHTTRKDYVDSAVASVSNTTLHKDSNLSDVPDRGVARGNLDVPSTGGQNATGTWGINITGNAQSANNATHASSADSATSATSAGSASTASRLDAAGWAAFESGGFMYFQYNGSTKMRLDTAGNLLCTGDIVAFQTGI